jgi:hypothetical protein
MKILIRMLSLDFKLIFRDKISLYIVMAPALLAFILIFSMTGAVESTMTIAIDHSLPAHIQESLAQIGSIESFSKENEIRTRIASNDAAVGVFEKNGALVILLEGNEPPEFQEQAAFLIDRALNSILPEFEIVQVQSKNSFLLNILKTSLILLSIVLAGTVSGFSIVQEREGDIVRALAISPIRLKDYLWARLITAMLISVITVFINGIIMGMVKELPELLMITIAGIGVPGLMLLLMGTYAKNQINAVALMKILMPIFLFIPLSSIFVPVQWRFFYYPFPMYWQFRGIQEIIQGESYYISGLFLLITGVSWYLGAVWLRSHVLEIRR